MSKKIVISHSLCCMSEPWCWCANAERFLHYLLGFHDYHICTFPAACRNSFVIFLWNSKYIYSHFMSGKLIHGETALFSSELFTECELGWWSPQWQDCPTLFCSGPLGRLGTGRLEPPCYVLMENGLHQSEYISETTCFWQVVHSKNTVISNCWAECLMNSSFPRTIHQRHDLGPAHAPPGLNGCVPLT